MDTNVGIEISHPSTIQDGVHPVIENGSDLPSYRAQAYHPCMTKRPSVSWGDDQGYSLM